MKKIVLIKCDNYNFCLAEQFDEPKVSVVSFKGVETELTATHNKMSYYYGRLGDAVLGLARYNNRILARKDIHKSLFNIKPSDDENSFNFICDKTYDEVIDILFGDL